MTETVAPPTEPTTAADAVRLEVPAVHRYLRLVRLTAAGLAADLGFGTDAIEDLRVAVDELCAATIDGTAPGSELVVTFRTVDGALHVDGICAGAHADPLEVHAIAEELLSILADEHAVEDAPGERRFHVVKGPRPTP
jgi:hypothetical protein